MPLWQCLFGLMMVAAFLRNGRAAIIACVLLANWLACTYAVKDAMWPDGTTWWNWPGFALVDFCSGMIVIKIARDRAALLIAASYVAELAFHVAYGASELVHGPATQDTKLAYWLSTHWAAWLQAWLIALWLGRDTLQMVGSTAVGDRRRMLFWLKGTGTAFHRVRDRPDVNGPDREMGTARLAKVQTVEGLNP